MEIFSADGRRGDRRAIVHELDRTRSGPIDLTSYAMPAALAFQSYSYTPISVEIDGRFAFGPKPALVFIGNVPEYGTGFPVLPLARSDDGVLDVCILPCESAHRSAAARIAGRDR